MEAQREYRCLRIERAQRVAVVWLARPQARNAFDDAMVVELTQAFARLGADAAVRAVVLAAQGPAFCAGADLGWMRRVSGYSLDESRQDAQRLAAMLRAIDTCPKPVIARVQGDAYAGGVGLVAVCDIAVASFDARFCLSETRLGLIPATIGPYLLRALGPRMARRYLLTAERFDAAEAFRIGLLHDLAPPAELDDRIDALLTALMQTSAAAVTATKALLRDLAGRPLDEALAADTAERIAQVRASDDGREGIASFLEKRKPRWQAEFDAERAAAGEAP